MSLNEGSAPIAFGSRAYSSGATRAMRSRAMGGRTGLPTKIIEKRFRHRSGECGSSRESVRFVARLFCTTHAVAPAGGQQSLDLARNFVENSLVSTSRRDPGLGRPVQRRAEVPS